MKLQKVEYDFFEFEEPAAEATVLDRQLRLRGFDGRILHISWTSERSYGPDSPAYSIGFRESSYFEGDPPTRLNASETPLWSPLCGDVVTLRYVDPDCFILEVAGPRASVYCCAADEDVVRLYSSLPAWIST